MKWFSALPLCLVLLGCGPNERSVVGKYTGELVDTQTGVEPLKNLEQGLASSMTLELKEDKTFHMVMTMLPIDGKWSMEGDTVTCTPDKVLGFSGTSSGSPFKLKAASGVLEPLSDIQGRRFRFVKEGSKDEF